MNIGNQILNIRKEKQLLLKEDSKMVQSMDKERAMGIIKHEKSIIDFFTGAGTGIVVSCLFSPDSSIRTTVIIGGRIIVMGIVAAVLAFVTPETGALLGYQKSRIVGRILGILLIVVGMWVGFV